MENLSRNSKRKIIYKFFTSTVILLLFFIIHIGCSTLELESQWRDREIKVDGEADDWQGAKYYLEDLYISVGLINDDRFLYISMIAENPMIRAQIMSQGLVVWLDPKGKKEKTFGIKFPVGQQWDERPARESLDEFDREEAMDRFRESMKELEILGPGEDIIEKINVEEAKGIDVKLRIEGGLLVYELKVPLTAGEDYPYAVGVGAGDWIGIGFESPKLEMQRPRGIRGGGIPGGGRIPGEGLPRDMGMRGGMPLIPQQLKIWAKVQLASLGDTGQISF
jgi:hypothetical protein